MHFKYIRTIFVAALLVFPAFVGADEASDAAQKAALQAQLDAINVQIKQNSAGLSQLQTQRTSLERDVAILDAKIKDAQLAIKARDLAIRQLKASIAEKESGIRNLDSKVADGHESIAQMLRETRQIDDLSLVQIALAGNLSDLMQEIDDFQSVQRALDIAFKKMGEARDDLSARKLALEDQQQEQQDLLQIQVLQQNTLKSTEKEKQNLVKAAKGQESVYQKLIAGQKQTAAQIQAALFSLRDTKSVSFGDIYAYAREAGARTGVRPALILGILAEESNLGKNVGSGSWKVDMHPTRDAPLFKKICEALGINPDTQPVSKKPWYGWGGAMGPAQFIPSTWVLYADRIGEIIGQNPPNPWDPRTAAYATALLMADNGATAKTPQAERLAALRYLAGWKNATKPAYAFYGDDVMSLTAKFQSQIDVLGG
jgi:peptidoglycan hydrolase CwlO-like protein